MGEVVKVLNTILTEIRNFINRAGGTTYPANLYAVMTSLDTQYEIELPPNTEQFSVQCQDGTEFRVSFHRDTVANKTPPYATVRAGKIVEGVAWRRV